MDRTRLIFIGIVSVALVVVAAVFFLNGGVDGNTTAVSGLVNSERRGHGPNSQPSSW